MLETGYSCIERERAQADFPLLAREIDGRRVIYLDNAATSLTPRAVVDEMQHFYLHVAANIHRGKHYLSEESSTRYEQTRSRIASWLGCFGSEVVFVPNTTIALNIVAQGLELDRGDLVVATADAHHSNLLPWMHRARLEMARVDSHGVIDLDHFQSLLERGPKVVALTGCSNVTGLYAPIQQMTVMAREVGALVVLDAAQWVPHRRLSVQEIPADFVCFSAHKMLGPTGIGVLYGRQSRLEALQPRSLGGGVVDWVTPDDYRLRKVPHRFEPGTPNIGGVYGFAAALQYLEDIGAERLAAHDRALGQFMRDQARARSYLRIIGDADIESGATMSMRVEGIDDLGEIARILSDSYGVMCRSGHLCAQPLVDSLSSGQVLRASAYLYNTERDLITLFDALDEVYEWIAG